MIKQVPLSANDAAVVLTTPQIVLMNVPLGCGSELNGLALSRDGAILLRDKLSEGISEYDRQYPQQ